MYGSSYPQAALRFYQSVFEQLRYDLEEGFLARSRKITLAIAVLVGSRE